MAVFVVVSVFIVALISGSSGVDLSYSVSEELASTKFLGFVGIDANIESLATAEQIKNMRYSFLNVDNFNSNFVLVENSGSLSTVARLDRESLCQSQPQCVLQLRIGASSGTFFLTINIVVTVLDTNDKKPHFAKNSIAVPIPERSPVNSTFPILSASDADAEGTDNSKVVYELQPNSGTFGLILDVNPQGKIDVSIILKQAIDREILASYQIYVVAKDLGTPQLSSMLTVNVTVQDYNDNKPIFTSDHYTTTVQEDVALNTVVKTVTASDKDAGSNGEVRYAFSDSTTTNTKALFNIHETSGEITVKQELTVSDDGAPLQLFVTAYDNGFPQQTSETLVDIHVIDINNHAPEININVLSSSLKTATVPENSNVGTIVAYVAVRDRDSSDNGKVTCSISNTKFTLVPDTNDDSYKVATLVKLDREETIEHVVTVYCRDQGTPMKNNSASFIVQVQDENDNRPLFSKDVYYANISENNEVGIMVTRVMASDMDQGENANVRFYVEPSFADQFYVEPGKGFVKANVRFDRELIEQIKFKVLAVDGGTPTQYTSTATVILTILDVNDEYPTFTKNIFEFNITENGNPDTQVGNLTAEDKDTGNNGKIVFTLLPRFQMTIPFMVHPNGTISANRALNRELKSNYRFTVMATDQGIPIRNSSAEVIIRLLDENDNYPQITNPVQNNGTVVISHLTAQGSEVTRVEAYDLDEGRNQALVYSIARRDQDLFYMEESTGKIYLGRKIETSDIKEYNLFIVVSDKGTTPKQSGADIKIKIEYTQVASKSEGAIGQNVLIAISIACVTIVLSLAIIVTIFLIRRMDHQKDGGCGSVVLTDNEELKGLERIQLPPKKPCISREGARSPVINTDNYCAYTNNTADIKKEVSFSLDDHRDSGIFMIANDHPSPVPVTRPLHLNNNSPSKYTQNVHGLVPHSNTDLSETWDITDAPQEELHRMASIRLHQKLIQSYNKPLVYHPDENRQLLLNMKKNLEDSRSDGSGDVTTTDSGRGGSDEDMTHHPSIMI